MHPDMFISPIINTIVGAIIGGLITLVIKLLKEKKAEEDAMSMAVKALLHDRFFEYARAQIDKGHMTVESMENLDRLHQSYKALGMNGTGEKLWNECKKLPIE